MKSTDVFSLATGNDLVAADLNALRAMAGYMEQELAAIAPECALLARMLERSIHAETLVRQRHHTDRSKVTAR